MAFETVVLIYSKVAPHSLCATILTDENDHPNTAVLARPECNPAGYTFNGNPCSATTITYAQYQTLTIPIEEDAIVSATIATAAASAVVVI